MVEDKKLVSIAIDFTRAALKRQDDDFDFETRFLEATGEEEATAIMNMIVHLPDSKEQSAEIYADAVFKMANRLAVAYNKFCTYDEIQEMLPPAAKEEGVAEAFMQHNARAMARICA